MKIFDSLLVTLEHTLNNVTNKTNTEFLQIKYTSSYELTWNSHQANKIELVDPVKVTVQ